MFVAVLLLCLPAVRVLVFSTGKRASSSLMDLVIFFMNKIDGAKARIVKRNQEQLFICTTARVGEGKSAQDAEDTARLYSYPAGSDALRGCTGDLGVMEEVRINSISLVHSLHVLEVLIYVYLDVVIVLDGLCFAVHVLRNSCTFDKVRFTYTPVRPVARHIARLFAHYLVFCLVFL